MRQCFFTVMWPLLPSKLINQRAIIVSYIHYNMEFICILKCTNLRHWYRHVAATVCFTCLNTITSSTCMLWKWLIWYIYNIIHVHVITKSKDVYMYMIQYSMYMYLWNTIILLKPFWCTMGNNSIYVAYIWWRPGRNDIWNWLKWFNIGFSHRLVNMEERVWHPQMWKCRYMWKGS